MRLIANATVQSEQWDAKVIALGGTVYQSSSYAHYITAADRNAMPLFLTLPGRNGEVVGAALGFVTRSPWRLLSKITTSIWLPAFPAVSTVADGALPAFVSALGEYARSAGAVVLTIQSSASRGGRETLREFGYALTERWEFEIDLGQSESELWKGMESKRRRNINKAVRERVTVGELSVEQGIAELRRLQEHSSRRIVARGGPDISAEQSRRVDPVGELLKSGVGRIVTASLAGKVVSAALLTCFNGLVYYTLAGHSEEALRSQAPTLLLWDTIKWYKNLGAKRFNFGGCSREAAEESHPENGVYIYKMGFGAERMECTSGRKVLRPLRRAVRQAIKSLLNR